MIDEKRAFRDWPASCATQFIEDLSKISKAGVWLLIGVPPACGRSVWAIPALRFMKV